MHILTNRKLKAFVRINSGIRASNEEDSRVLSLRQLLEHFPVRVEVVGLELVNAFKQLPHRSNFSYKKNNITYFTDQLDWIDISSTSIFRIRNVIAQSFTTKYKLLEASKPLPTLKYKN
jgi:hypothetical protein